MRADVALDDRKLVQRGRGRRACFFDANKMEPDFSDTAILKKFISERGKIVPAAKSGVCAKHQRQVTRAIKQARQLGLLPYLNR
jgi:small subunit ribosomal protein S18